MRRFLRDIRNLAIGMGVIAVALGGIAVIPTGDTVHADGGQISKVSLLDNAAWSVMELVDSIRQLKPKVDDTLKKVSEAASEGTQAFQKLGKASDAATNAAKNVSTAADQVKEEIKAWRKLRASLAATPKPVPTSTPAPPTTTPTAIPATPTQTPTKAPATATAAATSTSTPIATPTATSTPRTVSWLIASSDVISWCQTGKGSCPDVSRFKGLDRGGTIVSGGIELTNGACALFTIPQGVKVTYSNSKGLRSVHPGTFPLNGEEICWAQLEPLFR